MGQLPHNLIWGYPLHKEETSESPSFLLTLVSFPSIFLSLLLKLADVEISLSLPLFIRLSLSVSLSLSLSLVLSFA